MQRTDLMQTIHLQAIGRRLGSKPSNVTAVLAGVANLPKI
jgi:hypothetical protein